MLHFIYLLVAFWNEARCCIRTPECRDRYQNRNYIGSAAETSPTFICTPIHSSPRERFVDSFYMRQSVEWSRLGNENSENDSAVPLTPNYQYTRNQMSQQTCIFRFCAELGILVFGRHQFFKKEMEFGKAEPQQMANGKQMTNFRFQCIKYLPKANAISALDEKQLRFYPNQVRKTAAATVSVFISLSRSTSICFPSVESSQRSVLKVARIDLRFSRFFFSTERPICFASRVNKI